MLLPNDVAPRKRHTPFPHQEKAVKAILKCFKSHNRAHAVMACGTGKTHVCLWVAERLKAKRIAIFVPSLALVNQLLHEWLANTHWKDVSFMAVCSDETVAKGVDSFALTPNECDFAVTTSSVEAHRFLKNKKSEIQLTFCTYHSSGVLAAGMIGCKPFDLCVFDEAHKTTGVYDRTFAIPVSDYVPARKKLFVTATPRHYDIRHRNKEGDAKLLYSMDSELFYGPRAYTLTFRKAVEQDIIADYKVLIPIIIKESVKGRARISGEN